MSEPAFRILGNLQVVGGAGPVAVGGRRRRALLAHLLVHAGRRLSLDSICDAVWDGEPPAGAPSTVRTYLSQFRKLDGDGAGLLIEPDPSGYLVMLDRGKLDATAFEDLLDTALQTADPSARLEHLEPALALWRGTALAEFADSEWASAEAQRLEAQRQVAIAARFDALLTLGRHDECLGELDAAVAASPFDERLAARLALARYRSGQPSDALRDLAALRRRLVDELGLSPGAEVTDLERRILDHDSSLAHTPIQPEPVSATEPTKATASPESPKLPDGTVTFLFTDLEGSTRMLHQLGAEAYAEVLGTHRSLISNAVFEHGGVVFGSEGDALFCAFSSTPAAVSAAFDAQHALRTAEWALPVRVRMGLHTGEALVVGDDYVGSTVHVVARIAATGHGGQVVASDACRSLAPDASWIDLGTHRLKDVERAQRLHQLVVDPDDAFPPLATSENVPTNLPESVDDFVGRSDDVAALTAQLTEARLVTLAGPGGVGKTRLAIETARESRAAHPGGVQLVELARLGAGGDVAGSVLRTLVDAGGRGDDLPSVIADLTGDSSTLLVLDNCEHVVEATAALIDGLLASQPNLRVLATSREPLRVRGEHVRQVSPLSTSSGTESDAGAGRSPAEQLFVARTEAATGRPVSDVDAAIVRRICDDLDGLPLAIELAASRTTSLALVDIGERLENRFTLLRSTRSGDDARHRTLAGVVDWSYELLSSPDRLLFNRLSVFADPFTLSAAEAVGAGGSIDIDAVLDGISNLVNKSLVQLTTIEGVPAYRMLGTLRAYGRRRLEEADALDEAERRFTNWAVGVTAGLERDMRTARQDAALRDVIVHRGNLRFAHELLLEAGHVVDALRIVTSAPIDIPAERARLIDLLMPLVEADEGINEANARQRAGSCVARRIEPRVRARRVRSGGRPRATSGGGVPATGRRELVSLGVVPRNLLRVGHRRPRRGPRCDRCGAGGIRRHRRPCRRGQRGVGGDPARSRPRPRRRTRRVGRGGTALDRFAVRTRSLSGVACARRPPDRSRRSSGHSTRRSAGDLHRPAHAGLPCPLPRGNRRVRCCKRVERRWAYRRRTARGGREPSGRGRAPASAVGTRRAAGRSRTVSSDAVGAGAGRGDGRRSRPRVVVGDRSRAPSPRRQGRTLTGASILRRTSVDTRQRCWSHHHITPRRINDMTHITGIDHVALTVSNADASSAFYSELLGASEAIRHDDDTVSVRVLSGNGFLLGLRQYHHYDHDRFSEFRTGMDHVAFGIADVAAFNHFEEVLVRLGAPYTPACETPIGSVLVFRDPDGIQGEIFLPAGG